MNISLTQVELLFKEEYITNGTHFHKLVWMEMIKCTQLCSEVEILKMNTHNK